MLLKKDLAATVGVSPSAVSQYENGTSTPSSKVIAAMALALGVPAAFFASDRPLGEAPATTAHFRSLRSTSQRERDKAFAHALLAWELTRTIERHVQLPEVALPSDLALSPDSTVQDAERIARLTREALGLGVGPLPNVVRLLESLGVACTRLPAKTRRVFAFSCDFPLRPVVVLSTERQYLAAGRFDCAHELGHLVMHHDTEPGTHPVENQAHGFASEFIAPASQIADLLPTNVDWSRLLELKTTWGISVQALLYRARRLGVMSEHTYRRAVTEINRRGWRTNEPGDDQPAERPVLLQRALELCEGQGVSVHDIAEQSRLSLDTIELLIDAAGQRPKVDLTS